MASASGGTSPSGQKNRAAKLSPFLADLLRCGSVKGFKYFRFYLRGREELLITVMNEPRSITPMPSPSSSMDNRRSSRERMERLPRNQDSLMLSSRTQRRLSGYGYINVGLPPASPSEREIIVADENSTTFLIAAYARYSCPYVWVRTNHDRLIRTSNDDSTDKASAEIAKDNPLRLTSTSAWAEKNIKVWDVIAEIVEICCAPSPHNPFAVDFNYFDALQGMDRVLVSGAMVFFLQRVLDGGSHPYDSQVFAEIQILGKMHFQAVHKSVG